MKLNKVTIICLSLAAVLTVGIFVVRAAGFVSYEDAATSPKLYFWDNVRMITNGLKMSPTGVADAEAVPGGTIKIIGKDVFVRGFVGFDCKNYPKSTQCNAAIGNIGDSFLAMDRISSGTNLTFESKRSGITLNAQLAGNIAMDGKLILNGSDLIVSGTKTSVPADMTAGGNVVVDKLVADEFTAADPSVGLTVTNLEFNEVPSSAEAPINNVTKIPIIFYPKRIISLDLTTGF